MTNLRASWCSKRVYKVKKHSTAGQQSSLAGGTAHARSPPSLYILPRCSYVRIYLTESDHDSAGFYCCCGRRERKKLAGVREATVGEYGLGYHAGERQHRKTAVGDLLELHVRLSATKKRSRRSEGRGGGGWAQNVYMLCIHTNGCMACAFYEV